MAVEDVKAEVAHVMLGYILFPDTEELRCMVYDIARKTRQF